MCSSLGRWHQVGLQYSVNFEWRQLCCKPISFPACLASYKSRGPQIMTLIFTTIGSAADYGTFGRWLLLVITCICWASQFAEMSLTSMSVCSCTVLLANLINEAPSRWPLAMALYMIGFITYGATLVFYAALFPRLARNTLRSRTLREKFEAGDISQEEYEVEESLEKNRISNISTVRTHFLVRPAINVSSPQDA